MKKKVRMKYFVATQGGFFTGRVIIDGTEYRIIIIANNIKEATNIIENKFKWLLAYATIGEFEIKSIEKFDNIIDSNTSSLPSNTGAICLIDKNILQSKT